MDWVYLDALSERAHRCLMRVRYLAGDRTGALQQYERCEAMLKDELGVRPSAQTEALYARVQAGQRLDAESDGSTSAPAHPPAGIIDLLGQIEDDLYRLRAMVLAEAERIEHDMEARPSARPDAPPAR